MNKHSALSAESLLERAAQMYDFGSALRRPPALEPLPEPEVQAASEPAAEAEATPIAATAPQKIESRPVTSRSGQSVGIDREDLRKAGFIVPEAPTGALAEEFRIIKRQLLASVKAGDGAAEDKSRMILVGSAQPGEGKTFCAINLALSLAAERDLEVLLVDGDFNKPEIFPILGVEAGPGLIDAIAEPGADIENFVVETDIRGLSLLPAGRQANNVTELLASNRTREVLADLARNHPGRIIIFDSPPALMASPAGVLAAYVGQLLMVVRADQTIESDLREAVALLSDCDTVSLVLNGEAFAAGGRRFGSYYGYGQ